VAFSLRRVGVWAPIKRSLPDGVAAFGATIPATLQLNVPAQAMEPYTHHFVAQFPTYNLLLAVPTPKRPALPPVDWKSRPVRLLFSSE